MYVEIDGLPVHYIAREGRGTPILLLHGWGCSLDAMRGLFDYFASCGTAVLALDFSGFGLSQEPTKPLTIYDYARITSAFIERVIGSKPDIIAHSFGGRVAILLAAENKVNRLILTAAAGIKPRFSFRRAVRIAAYKLRKRLALSTKSAGSPDYRAASPVMRRVLVSVLSSPLDCVVSRIHCPTLLIWGDRDRDTPLYMAKKLRRRIRDSALIIFRGKDHFAYLQEPRRFALIAQSFFGGTP